MPRMLKWEYAKCVNNWGMDEHPLTSKDYKPELRLEVLRGHYLHDYKHQRMHLLVVVNNWIMAKHNFYEKRWKICNNIKRAWVCFSAKTAAVCFDCYIHLKLLTLHDFLPSVDMLYATLKSCIKRVQIADWSPDLWKFMYMLLINVSTFWMSL